MVKNNILWIFYYIW